ncbi:hypothetical protein BDQ12DRAFT_673099 [Crucibulum laeve]|uniref:Rho GTPase activation protein n=1 Tax=Crucibulum laeve TaxID=68775 RepID=A0A5C3MGH5_9AGAR|nr:hypothetical protein BDQ12DRAFT_673099 [Crucibulum laeve]
MDDTTKPASETTSKPPPASALGKHPVSRQASTSSSKAKAHFFANGGTPPNPNVKNARSPPGGLEGEDAAWGSNFWVTLVEPQTQTKFFACPATGQVSWDPPVGNFLLPPTTEGEWWELSDDSRGGIPYYYQTKTGETVWDRPEGFIIPLGLIQNTALGRRLSQIDRFSRAPSSDDIPDFNTKSKSSPQEKQQYRRSQSYANGEGLSQSDRLQIRPTSSTRSSPGHTAKMPPIRRSTSGEYSSSNTGLGRFHTSPQLTPIPGSPYTTEHSTPPSPSSERSTNSNGKHSPPKEKESGSKFRHPEEPHALESAPPVARSKSAYSHRSPKPQSLQAAAEILTNSHSDSGHSSPKSPAGTPSIASHSGAGYGSLAQHIMPTTPTKNRNTRTPPSPQRPIPSIPKLSPTVGGKKIGAPVLNSAATMEMSPVKNRSAGQPIPVERLLQTTLPGASTATLRSGTYPALPHALATEIQHFSESEYARHYFSTHRSGFIFRRKVPVAQLMTWQKAPLTSPLLMMNRTLHKEAVKVFKVIQHIMGDREREKAVGVRLQPDNHVSMVVSINASTASLAGNAVLEEERWLLTEGLTHGELRDEIYCQLMKQLTGNPNTASIFKGWQLLCVILITFPPSKNFETYLEAFIQKYSSHQEGRVDVMAKHCLRRLAAISKKGPRGKPPAIAEIETASDAAFNPSTFGESLDAIIRLQERNYPRQKVPIILPFLADGILALGGPKSEGIFRVPGDNDSVSELKLRIDRGYYTLDGVDDPHVLASLMKLWLRELCDPLIPDEMYNECIINSKDPEACIRIIERLPTINRRVVLFVISFLQLFLEERTQNITKMTSANLALVMAPNLLRCNSDSMSVVFTNAQYEQIFVYNLLLHLRCSEVDPSYKPTHGLGAVPDTPAPRTSKSRSRRPN